MIRHLAPVVEQIQTEGLDVVLRPEVMGRLSQWGDLDETLNLCAALPRCLPCLDFAHLHARHGRHNTYAEFIAVLDAMVDRLGRPALDDMHIHLSGIAYGAKGELHHLTLTNSDFNYRDCLRALRDRECQGLVIGESPAREWDVLLLQQVWREFGGEAVTGREADAQCGA